MVIDLQALEEKPCITAGIDPGSSHLGLAVLAADGSVLLTCTLDVGHMAGLVTPRSRTRADGKVRTTTQTRVLDEQDVRELTERVGAILVEHKVEKLILEWVESAYMKGSEQAKNSVATCLSRSQWVGGAIAGLAMALGIPVRYTTARHWVSQLTRGCQKGRRGIVADVVEAAYPTLKADEHARDAVGLVMWDRMRLPKEHAHYDGPPREKKGRKCKSKAPPGVEGTSVATEKVKPPRVYRERCRAGQMTNAKLVRQEAGCTCTSPRHVRSCVLYQRKVYRKRAAS